MISLNGVLPVDKPAGPTSHDIVAIARRALGIRRIGHTGTLDPLASGLLLLCLGASTRLAEFLSGLPKSYSATLRLGAATDTDDREGAVLRTSEGWASLSREQVESALLSQQGERLQVPPRFSAKKVGGERLYAIARAGGEVEPEPVLVRIHSIVVTRFAPPDVDFEVDCGSGTYMRAIARDAGEALGVGAHLVELRRTRVGVHSIESAITMNGLSDPSIVEAALMSPAKAVGHLPAITLSLAEVATVSHGGSVELEGSESSGPLAVLDADGDLVAIGHVEGGRLRPSKVFR